MSITGWAAKPFVEITKYLSTRTDLKKLCIVSLALIVSISAPLIYLCSSDEADPILIGIIISSIGKVAELVGKTKKAETNDVVKDGLELFGSGITFFGIIMVIAAAAYGFDYQAG